MVLTRFCHFLFETNSHHRVLVSNILTRRKKKNCPLVLQYEGEFQGFVQHSPRYSPPRGFYNFMKFRTPEVF